MADAAIMVLARMRRIAPMCAAADFLESRDERARVADAAQNLRRCGGVNTRAVSATCASSSWRLASTSCLAAGCEGLSVDNLRSWIACVRFSKRRPALLSRQLASFWRVALQRSLRPETRGRHGVAGRPPCGWDGLWIVYVSR